MARGVFMEEAAPAGSGKMVAVLNADLATIERPVKRLVSWELYHQQPQYTQPDCYWR